MSLFFRERSCFSFAATFMPLINSGDVLCMHATSQGLKSTVFHGALRFTTNIKALTRYCTLCMLRLVGQYWPLADKTIGRSSATRPNFFPQYLCGCVHVKRSRSYSLHSVTQSQDILLFSVPELHLEMGKMSLRHAAGEFVSGGEGLFKPC